MSEPLSVFSEMTQINSRTDSGLRRGNMTTTVSSSKPLEITRSPGAKTPPPSPVKRSMPTSPRTTPLLSTARKPQLSKIEQGRSAAADEELHAKLNNLEVRHAADQKRIEKLESLLEMQSRLLSTALCHYFSRGENENIIAASRNELGEIKQLLKP